MAKTGGTTFTGHLYKHLEWDRELIHFGLWGDDYRKKSNMLPFGERPIEEREKAIVLAGHNTYYGIHKYVPCKTPRYITILRDPAERLVSAYNFQMKDRSDTDVINFEDWYKSYPKNFMTKFFAGKLPYFLQRGLYQYKWLGYWRAKYVLHRCWFVGIQSNLNKDLRFLFREIGVPQKWKDYRVTGDKKSSPEDLEHPDKTIPKRRFVLDEATRKRIYLDNPLDIKLYRYSLNLNNGANIDLGI